MAARCSCALSIGSRMVTASGKYLAGVIMKIIMTAIVMMIRITILASL